MKNLFLKLFILIILTLSLLFSIGLLADGYTDPFYVRFTSPKQSSLILGTSRAAQGLLPDIIDSALAKTYPSLKIYNFAFTLAHSPYGPVYYNAICNKLKKGGKNGLFILAVDPWSISAKQENPNEASTFFERKLCLGNINFFNMNPNIEYLIKDYNDKLISIIFNRFKKNKGAEFLHQNGWLEISANFDSIALEENTTNKIKEYRSEYLPYYKLSSIRLAYLDKTIKLLKNYGSVYLVRLPVHPQMKEIEDVLVPNFDEIICGLSNKNSVKYFNFIKSGNNYLYNDGNHLNKASGKVVSLQVATLIAKYN